MTIYPAIDIKGGKCVRLTQGRADQQTVCYQDPVEAAMRWKDMGASFLHVVDLDGAFSGDWCNAAIIKKIVKDVAIPVQVGGGVRSMERITNLLEEVGAARVILGTAAVEDPALIEQAVRRFGKGIAVGIDAKGSRIAVRGWVKVSDVTPVELGLKVKAMGVETIIYTDIMRDGMLMGPNIPSTREMIQRTGLKVIASGGISSAEHIVQLKSVGAEGVIIGKALYSGKIDLKEVLKLEER